MSTALPSRYSWLAQEPGPRMILEALKEYGDLEAPGAKNNPTILGWAKEANVSGYSADSIPWCGLFMALVAKRAGKKAPDKPLWALSWSKWGKDAGQPRLGDVLVFVRPGGGHVTLYVGEDSSCYHCLGGNQSDSVCVTRIPKSRLYASRNQYFIAPPKNVRSIILAPTGEVSVNEA